MVDPVSSTGSVTQPMGLSLVLHASDNALSAAGRAHSPRWLAPYPLEVLYANLQKLKARSVLVLLDACFSGTSHGGSLVPAGSNALVTRGAPPPPRGLWTRLRQPMERGVRPSPSCVQREPSRCHQPGQTHPIWR